MSFLTNIIMIITLRKLDGRGVWHAGVREVFTCVGAKPWRKQPLGRPRSRGENSFEIIILKTCMRRCRLDSDVSPQRPAVGSYEQGNKTSDSKTSQSLFSNWPSTPCSMALFRTILLRPLNVYVSLINLFQMYCCVWMRFISALYYVVLLTFVWRNHISGAFAVKHP